MQKCENKQQTLINCARQYKCVGEFIEGERKKTTRIKSSKLNKNNYLNKKVTKIIKLKLAKNIKKILNLKTEVYKK